MKKRYILLYLSYIIILLIILEFASRAIIPGYQRSIKSYDSQLVWKYVPNSRFNSISGSGIISINHLGFRDSNHPLENKNNSTRILFIGDSYTVGLSVSESDTFPRYLETKLNQNKTKRYEVFNLGISAYATDQEYIVLKNIGLRYNPDIVVLTVAPNDIREAYVKRLFYLDNGKLKLDKENKAFNLNLKDRFLWYLSRKSELFFTLQQSLGLNYGTSNYIFNHVTYGVFFHENKGYDVDQILFLKNETNEMKNATKLFNVLIEEINNLCLSNNCSLVIINLPTKMQFAGILKKDSFDLLKIQKILKNITSKNNITFLDLYSKINNSLDPLAYYMDTEYHLNKEGHKLVANELYDFLIKNHVIK